MNRVFSILSLSVFLFVSCDDEGGMEASCDTTNITSVDTSRSACTAQPGFQNQVTITVSGDTRTIMTNNIPDHQVGMGFPNPIGEVPETWNIDLTPSLASSTTNVLNLTTGPAYAFGAALNGIKIDPAANEPWEIPGSPQVDYTWNLEALMVSIGLDCNEGHVQPNGAYHYHGLPSLFSIVANASGNAMVQMGWAADGYPIYYRYGYSNANDPNSAIVDLAPSYQLKTGERPGDGTTEPCGPYTGAYTNDFEFVQGLGELDICNGREGVTPEFPNGTYYYVVTNDFPKIPRCFVGTPSNDFKIGP